MGRILKRKGDSPPILEEIITEDTPKDPIESLTEDLDVSLDTEIDTSIGGGVSRSDLKLPPVPGTYLNWDQWESYASKLTGDHWSHVDCYLYRYDPIIDQDPKYIDMFGQWRDFNYYITTHGGGKYGLSVCDRALPKRQQEICKVRIDVDKGKFDPILNYTTLDLGDKRNRAYITKLVNKGILAPDTLEVQVMQPRGNDQSELVSKLVDKVTDLAANNNNNRDNGNRGRDVENQAASAAIKMVSDVSQKLMEQQIANSNPLAQIEALAKLANLGQPKGDNGALEIMKLMMDMQKEANATLRESIKTTNERMEKLIEKIGESHNNNGGSNNMLDSLETMLSITEKLGGQGREPSITSSLIGLGEKVLPNIMNTLAHFAMAKQGGSLPIQNPSPTSPIAQNGVIESSPIPINEGVSQVSTITKQEVAQFISQFGPRITSAMERGDTGADLAQSLETLMGYDTYLQVRAVIEDKALVMEGAQMVPQFWTLVKGHGTDKFEAFLDSFLEWSTLREQGNDEGLAN